MNIITVKNASKIYTDANSKNEVLSGVNFSLKSGASVAITGPSGCGKTTFLQAMAGLDNFTSGEVNLCGYDMKNISAAELANLHNNDIGFVYQKSHLLPDFTLLENILLPVRISGKKNGNVIALGILKKLKLDKFANYYPNQISGGMQQKVAIGRAIANNPKVIFADEPTGNLDAASKAVVLDTLFDLTREYGSSLCIVTHDSIVADRTDITISMNALNGPYRV